MGQGCADPCPVSRCCRLCPGVLLGQESAHDAGMLAEIVPPNGDAEMAHITSVRATPRYERASGEVTLKVDAHGEYERDGIELVETPSPDGYCVEGTILVIAIRFTQGNKKLRRWSDTKSLTCDGHVLAVRRVEKG